VLRIATTREVIMPTNVRYIVDDVDAAIGFYVDHLGFTVDFHPAPGFARLVRDDLVLLLNQPGAGGAGQPAGDGRMPEPGGWNRFQLEVDDLDATVAGLRDRGVAVRTDVVEGAGGRQALVDDPAGNCIELFEPAKS
jgi:catechol 2,3-dioxygenase-like lactoylglutathione lyase family enzyme